MSYANAETRFFSEFTRNIVRLKCTRTRVSRNRNNNRFFVKQRSKSLSPPRSKKPTDTDIIFSFSFSTSRETTVFVKIKLKSIAARYEITKFVTQETTDRRRLKTFTKRDYRQTLKSINLNGLYAVVVEFYVVGRSLGR